MDLIGGIVVATSVFVVSMTLVTLFVRPPAGERNPHQLAMSNKLTHRVLAVSLVVYFVAVVNLLLIAQQVNLALGSFVVGVVLLVMYYIEPALRTRGSQAAEESESWEE